MYRVVNETDKNALMCFSNVFFGKWKLLILYELSDGEKRFSDIKKSLGRLSSKILTQSTEELLNEGLIVRVPYPEVPPRVCYRLSKQGRAFLPLLEQMLTWGKGHQKYRSQWKGYGKSQEKQR